jgi:hypothetical protein
MLVFADPTNALEFGRRIQRDTSDSGVLPPVRVGAHEDVAA